jgi:hypothetical protein
MVLRCSAAAVAIGFFARCSAAAGARTERVRVTRAHTRMEVLQRCCGAVAFYRVFTYRSTAAGVNAHALLRSTRTRTRARTPKGVTRTRVRDMNAH